MIYSLIFFTPTLLFLALWALIFCLLLIGRVKNLHMRVAAWNFSSQASCVSCWVLMRNLSSRAYKAWKWLTHLHVPTWRLFSISACFGPFCPLFAPFGIFGYEISLLLGLQTASSIQISLKHGKNRIELKIWSRKIAMILVHQNTRT